MESPVLSMAPGKLSSLPRTIITLALALLLVLGLSAVTTQPASAMTTSCNWPRCTVNLSKKETRSYAYHGILPSFPSSTGIAQAAYYVAAMTNRWFAIQYANKGMCVSFVLSAAPWERQGMYGRRC